MNPGERDRNPFRNNGQGSTAKYFGGRSKYNDSRNSSRTSSYFAQQPAQTFYAAPAPQPERKKKPWVLIGAGGFLAIALIVGAVIVVSRGGNPLDFTPTSNNFAELKTTIEEHRAAVEYYDGAFSVVDTGKIRLGRPTSNLDLYKETADNLEKHLNDLTVFRNKLNRFKGVKAIDYYGDEVDVDEYIDRLKKSLDARMGFYSYYKQLDTAIINYYIEQYSSTALQKVKDVSNDNKIIDDLKKIKRHKEIEKELADKNCEKSTENQECKQLLYEMADIKNTAYKSTALLENLKNNLAKNNTEDDPLILINEITSLKKVEK